MAVRLTTFMFMDGLPNDLAPIDYVFC
jgi:hypothetical protein